MKNYTMFNYDYLFSDHFAKVSNQAKLYYIKLNFYAVKGFVANPLSVLDSLGFSKDVFDELVKNDEILTLPDRCEIFLTSYFVHNPRFNNNEWWKSPFAVYWRGKLSIKKNGIATFNSEGLKPWKAKEPLSNVEAPSQYIPSNPQTENDDDWDKMMAELDELPN